MYIYIYIVFIYKEIWYKGILRSLVFCFKTPLSLSFVLPHRGCYLLLIWDHGQMQKMWKPQVVALCLQDSSVPVSPSSKAGDQWSCRRSLGLHCPGSQRSPPGSDSPSGQESGPPRPHRWARAGIAAGLDDWCLVWNGLPADLSTSFIQGSLWWLRR